MELDGLLTADLTWLTLVVAPLLPVLVGIVTKRFAHSGLKAAVLLFLSGVTGVVNQAILDQGLITKEALVAAVVAYVLAVATHYGFLKPTHVTGADGVVQVKTENVGVGK